MAADVGLTALVPASMISVPARSVTANGPSDWLGLVRLLVG